MIIVIMGGDESLSTEIISQLMQSDIVLIRHLSIKGVASCRTAGLSRLKAEFDQPSKITNVITIVDGVTTAQELDYLRNKSALICHCYGQLSTVYDQVSISSVDKLVLPAPLPLRTPDHIYTPDEVLSECYIKG